MNNISVLEKTKDYVVLKIPRRLLARLDSRRAEMTEDEALKILKSGVAEHRKGQTKVLASLRDLRHGN